MQALTYQGSKNVRVETVPDPVLMADDDIVLRVTATAICGSDLHIYRGKIPMMKDGDILGHEFMGIEEDTGSAVTGLKRGERVVIPFVIPCGSCFYCSKTLFAGCENTNPGRDAILRKRSDRDQARGLQRQGASPVHRCHTPRWRREAVHAGVLERIGNGKLKPEVIITHGMPLADAAHRFEIFEKKKEDVRKVVLIP